MSLVRVSNGFGEILPHTTFRLENGVPTNEIISIRTLDDLLANVTGANPIRTSPRFQPGAILPDGEDGNHFFVAHFDRALSIDSILSSLPADGGLTGTITVVALDPTTGNAVEVPGRAFIDGQTYAGTPVGTPLRHPLQTWVARSGGATVADPAIDNNLDGFPDGLGFPGAATEFSGAGDLFGANSFVYVADSDNNLSTYEAFPEGFELRMIISTSVYAASGQRLAEQAKACTTVGPDTISPEARFSPPPQALMQAFPRTVDDQGRADPETEIEIQFTEPVQPWTFGDLPSGGVPNISAAFTVEFGPDTARTSVPCAVCPISPFDLATYVITPTFTFPGEGPEFSQCGVFNEVDLTVFGNQFLDLSTNQNSLAGNSKFFVGEGPGLVNAPVVPDAVYVGRGGSSPGLSIIDMNGFGGGTGNPVFDADHPNIEGNSNYPNNPNVRFQGGTLIPPLSPGTCTINGGSAGVFTLTKDSSLDNKVARNPILFNAGDMMIGRGLDTTYNNGPSPFGCQGGGGNLCANTGLKSVTITIDGSSVNPATGGIANGTQVLVDGGANLVSWSPHPNPPPLTFPPLCVSPFIGGQEPTSVSSGATAPNLLVGGDAFGDPELNIPPSGLISAQGVTFFQGPSASGSVPCATYGLRQQVGHFLYVVDRARREIVVLNSNRMTVIDRILLPDPTTLAMGPNLDILAVTNQTSNQVTLIDIDPNSGTFHEILKNVLVGDGPRGIAWEPGNEDILVCNEAAGSVSIISAFSLEVRKVVSSNLTQPFDVAITPRQLNFGFTRNVYFAYILNRSGDVSVFESGPNTVNGWGYDDVIGVATYRFLNPKAIQPDVLELRSGVWVLHEGPLDETTGQLEGNQDEGAATNLVVDSGIAGPIPLTLQIIPNFRDMHIAIKVSMGEERLSGVPVDMAFDNMLNLGAVINWSTSFSAGSPIPVNGKGLVRGSINTNSAAQVSAPRFAFFAVPNPSQGIGVVDVILMSGPFLRFDTNIHQEGIQSIPAEDCQVLMDYFRQ